MSYTLYGRPWSGSLTVEFMLEELGIPYQRSLVTRYRDAIQPPSFAEINPLREVPVLVDDDGLVMTESAAILLLLAQRRAENLLPPAGSALQGEHLRWMFYLAAAVYPPSMKIFHPDNSTDEPAHEASILARGTKVLNHQWGVVCAAIDGRCHMVGDSMTVVDFYLMMFAYWFAEMDGIEDSPLIRPFRERHLESDSARRVLARHISGDWV